MNAPQQLTVSLSGICPAPAEASGCRPAPALPPPNVFRVELNDLRKPLRLEALYFEFVRRGKLAHSEANALNFAAAAVRAGRLSHLSEQRRVRIFFGIIRRRLWGYITQAEEERARCVLRHVRETRPSFMRTPPWEVSGTCDTPSC